MQPCPRYVFYMLPQPSKITARSQVSRPVIYIVRENWGNPFRGVSRFKFAAPCFAEAVCEPCRIACL